jgi:hypothetical protein
MPADFQQKVPRTHNGERTVVSINGVRRTGYPPAEEWNWNLISHYIQKSKWIKIPEIIKFLEENIGGKKPCVLACTIISQIGPQKHGQQKQK